MRVVRVRETWTQREQRGAEWVQVQKAQNWLWVVAGDLDDYASAVIRDIGQPPLLPCPSPDRKPRRVQVPRPSATMNCRTTCETRSVLWTIAAGIF